MIFKVNKLKMSSIDKTNPATLKFEFDKTWDGFNKAVSFCSYKGVGGALLKDDKCALPDSIDKTFYIYVAGRNKDGVTKRTNNLTIRLEG